MLNGPNYNVKWIGLALSYQIIMLNGPNYNVK